MSCNKCNKKETTVGGLGFLSVVVFFVIVLVILL